MKYTVDTIAQSVIIEQGEVTTERIDELNKMYPGYRVYVNTRADIYLPQPQRQLTVGDMCSCNPMNGGSGICGCVIANQPYYPSATDYIPGYLQNISGDGR